MTVGGVGKMKPRLQPEPMTQEDIEAWVMSFTSSRTRRPGVILGRLAISAKADRRDADLFLHLKRAYADIAGWNRGYPGVWHAACAFQGVPITHDFCDAVAELNSCA